MARLGHVVSMASPTPPPPGCGRGRMHRARSAGGSNGGGWWTQGAAQWWEDGGGGRWRWELATDSLEVGGVQGWTLVWRGGWEEEEEEGFGGKWRVVELAPGWLGWLVYRRRLRQWVLCAAAAAGAAAGGAAAAAGAAMSRSRGRSLSRSRLHRPLCLLSEPLVLPTVSSVR